MRTRPGAVSTTVVLLLTAQHVYVLHLAGFERVAEVDAYASAKAREMTVALGDTVKFLDFTGLAVYVGEHKRAARLVAALHARQDLHMIRRSMFCKAAEEIGVPLETTGRKLTPGKGVRSPVSNCSITGATQSR